MQYIQRGSFKVHEAGKFQEWLVVNEAVFKDRAPAGWTYVGTWFTVLGFGRYDCETRWELTGYDVLGARDFDEAFLKALQESGEFFDPARGGETYLMKSAADIWVMPGV